MERFSLPPLSTDAWTWSFKDQVMPLVTHRLGQPNIPNLGSVLGCEVWAFSILGQWAIFGYHSLSLTL